MADPFLERIRRYLNYFGAALRNVQRRMNIIDARIDGLESRMKTTEPWMQDERLREVVAIINAHHLRIKVLERAHNRLENDIKEVELIPVEMFLDDPKGEMDADDIALMEEDGTPNDPPSPPHHFEMDAHMNESVPLLQKLGMRLRKRK